MWISIKISIVVEYGLIIMKSDHDHVVVHVVVLVFAVHALIYILSMYENGRNCCLK